MFMGTSRIRGAAIMLRSSMAHVFSRSPNRLAFADRRLENRGRPSYVRVYSPVPGVVVDLSRRGMALRTSSGFAVGEQVRFRARHRSRLFALSGVVRWCEAEPGSRGYLVGVELEAELSSAELEFLFGRLRQNED